MVDQATVTVLLSELDEERAIAEALARKLQNRTPKKVSANDPLTASSILVIGLQEQIDRWLSSHKLPVRPAIMQRNGTAYVWTVRNKNSVLAVVSAKDIASLKALARPLPHYGRQSYVVFDGAKVVIRGTWPASVQMVKLN